MNGKLLFFLHVKISIQKLTSLNTFDLHSFNIHVEIRSQTLLRKWQQWTGWASMEAYCYRTSNSRTVCITPWHNNPAEKPPGGSLRVEASGWKPPSTLCRRPQRHWPTQYDQAVQAALDRPGWQRRISNMEKPVVTTSRAELGPSSVNYNGWGGAPQGVKGWAS